MGKIRYQVAWLYGQQADRQWEESDAKCGVAPPQLGSGGKHIEGCLGN